MSRAYYSDQIVDFLSTSPDSIFGNLAKNHGFDLDQNQKRAWIDQIEILQQSLSTINSGQIFFEYSIPRIGKRVDCILLIQDIVFVIEFKVGSHSFDRHAIDQTLDYALDLKNFHQHSHNLQIVPILIATQAKQSICNLQAWPDGVYPCQKIAPNDLYSLIQKVLQAHSNTQSSIDPEVWAQSPYKPTPTIIQAAQALYKNHSVADISRSDAEATNLSDTSTAILEVIANAYKHKHKAICFITGVPGAGKTLAGLNIANHNLNNDKWGSCVFLSGNGPLVKVLVEALTRDSASANKENKKTLESPRDTSELEGSIESSKKAINRRIKAFIQNIHHFRDVYFENSNPPPEHVVIFDEAQRAWDQHQTSKFMQKKKDVPNFDQSEPEFLISVMDRHQDWAVIIALIGGGQEINSGEAGLPEWFRALQKSFSEWHVYASPNLISDEYTRGEDIFGLIEPEQLHCVPELHLGVSIRSFRAEHQSALVHAILNNQADQARQLYQQIKQNYPIYITRDIEQAKQWLKDQARGSERYGLLASSGAQRLRPYGVTVKVKAEVTNWLLDDRDDIRSSYFLEDTATEFDIQGLEIDWSCLGWDGNLRYIDGEWHYHKFRGSVWQNVNNPNDKLFTKNSYRVLLTRARQGMVIFVPPGSNDDPTRDPRYYDGTYEFLKSIGFDEL
jgi:hypothetical protein